LWTITGNLMQSFSILVSPLGHWVEVVSSALGTPVQPTETPKANAHTSFKSDAALAAFRQSGTRCEPVEVMRRLSPET